MGRAGSPAGAQPGRGQPLLFRAFVPGILRIGGELPGPVQLRRGICRRDRQRQDRRRAVSPREEPSLRSGTAKQLRFHMSSLRPRIIPCLQFTRGELLKTRRFKDPQYLGDPINAVKLFNDLECDELVVVDIRATQEGRGPDYAMVEEFASEAFMPLAYGGGISSIGQIRRILAIGIEKVVIGAAAAHSTLISSAAAVFGAQSIVAAVDVRRTLLGRHEVWTHSGTRNLRVDPRDYCLRMQESGAGEL